MNLKTYRAASIADALGQIKKDLGSDAVILHTRTYKQGGWLKLKRRQVVEITASSAVNVMHPLARKGKAAPEELLRPATDLVKQTYAASAPRAAVSLAPALAVEESVAVAEEVSAACAARGSKPVATSEAPATLVAPPGAPADGLYLELTAIKRMVGRVMQTSRAGAAPAMPEALFDQYLKLIEADVASEIADEIIAHVRDELNTEELASAAVVKQAILRRLESYLPVAHDVVEPRRGGDGRPLTIALVGPTGVGKTTTIAKLAAAYKLRHGKTVGLVTSDTYRIAAVEQLRTYADIINLPLKVAMSPDDVRRACEALSSCDVVLLDTAGRSQHDSGRLDELKAVVEAARPHETHLVLSSAAAGPVLERAIQRFSVVKPNRVLFTKVDEAVNIGIIVNAAQAIGVRLSYVTMGQEVPDHIEPSRPDRLARLVLEGSAG